MIKRYELVKGLINYMHHGKVALCIDGISCLFEIHGAARITLVVSDKKPTDDNNFYQVKKRTGTWCAPAVIFTDFGNEIYHTHLLVDDIINDFGGSCYFWIELP